MKTIMEERREIPVAGETDVLVIGGGLAGVAAAVAAARNGVSVTLLEAADSASWAGLRQDFNIIDTLPMVVEMIESGVLKKKMRLAPKRDYRLPKDSVFENNDLIVATYKSHTICIFHLENREQSHALYGKQLDDIKPKF